MPDNRPAQGMLYHVAGPIDGGWRVVEVWESQEAADRFFRDALGAALQRHGGSVQPKVMPVHMIIAP
jgi:hypothetical protein